MTNLWFWSLPLRSLAPLVCLRAHLQFGDEAVVLWCFLLDKKASTAVIGESGASPTKSAQDKSEFANAMGMEIPDR